MTLTKSNEHESPTSYKKADAAKKPLKHKRRNCKVEGCARTVKSQGLCQRHGAKPRSCSVDGCTKQAQGNYNGMCKLHFKMVKNQLNGGGDSKTEAPQQASTPTTTATSHSSPDTSDPIRIPSTAPYTYSQGFPYSRLEGAAAGHRCRVERCVQYAELSGDGFCQLHWDALRVKRQSNV